MIEIKKYLTTDDTGTNIGVETMARTRPYEETLKDALADPGQAAEYLNAALEEREPAAFLMALKDVANVHGGVGKLAEVASLNRENMYRILSEDGNPRIDSLHAILRALGLRLSIAPEKSRRSAA